MRAGADTRVLVTGATGFVGRALVDRLLFDGVPVTASVRREPSNRAGLREVRVEDLGPTTDWSAALADCDSVVHCAARVHVMADESANPIAEYRVTNVEGSVALAMQAATAGVRRFVFISSIKVNGDGTAPGAPYRATDLPAPADPYGVSKFEAEQALTALAAACEMELVIIRPPLVYGPGVKANFLSMARLIAHGVPLPLGGVNANRRSFVALGNLVDLIVTCLAHPKAVGQVFLVSDGEDLSTSELLRRTAAALGVPSRLMPVPASLLALGAGMLGRRDLWQRLGGTLQIDSAPTCDHLDWKPPMTVDTGLQVAVDGLRVSGAKK